MFFCRTKFALLSISMLYCTQKVKVGKRYSLIFLTIKHLACKRVWQHVGNNCDDDNGPMGVSGKNLPKT